MSKWPNEKLTLESANLQRLVLLKKCKYIGKTKIKIYDMQKKILIDTKSPPPLSLSLWMQLSKINNLYWRFSTTVTVPYAGWK